MKKRWQQEAQECDYPRDSMTFERQSATGDQRKTLKKAILAAQVQTNPPKRKLTALEADQQCPGFADEINVLAHNISPGKCRRHDTVTFEFKGFPPAEEAYDGAGMADLTHGWLFSVDHTSVPAPANNSSFGEFTHSSESQDIDASTPPLIATGGETTHVRRRKPGA
ncbi:hypothetical protein CTheo_7626 [Ceratobasidium theobromae]|uniref:Uncharacterized protein n=1 Tax=Ceratobasidium theobromae TaxID=1582974 RepID=A0A5N5QC26_9AGAM|nr:hypothetical protein CTheo_7626 [Ceratobasidium theobromae]